METSFDNMPKAVANIQKQLEDIRKLLTSQHLPIDDGMQDVLTISEAASILRLAVPTVYGLVHRSKIPVCKKGKRLYFIRHELLEWVKQGRKNTISEIDAKVTDALMTRIPKKI